MDTSSGSWRHAGQIDHEVPDGAEEVVLVCVPVLPRVGVGIRIDDRHTREVRRRFEHRQIERVTNQLRVVVLNNGFRHQIRARWEVHQGRSGGLRIAAETTPIPSRYGGIDGLRVVRGPVTYMSQCMLVLNFVV